MDSAVWIKNKLLHSIQSAMLVVSLATILGLVGWLLGGYLFALSAIAVMVVLYFFAPKVSPFLILKMLRGRRLSYHDAPRLYHVLEVLAKRAKLPRLPVLYHFPGSVMNAFTVGSPDSAAIAVSQSLLDGLSYSELSAVLAHEVSHIRSNDMRIIGFADMANRLIHGLSLMGQLLLIISLPLVLFGNSSINLIAIALLICAPFISAMLQLALSRTREYNADLGAVELMGNPEALATALAKIEYHGSTLFRRFAWPVNPNSQILRTHPPTRERIRRLLAIRDRESYSAGGGLPRPRNDAVHPIRIIRPTHNWDRILNIIH